MRRLLVLITLLTAGAIAPAVVASAQTPGPTPPAAPAGLSIRLAEIPADRADDPRALQYVVDHVAPGATFSRKIEVANDTGAPAAVRLYGGAAAVQGGTFAPVDGDAAGEVASWITVAPPTLELADGQKAVVVATVRVPKGAKAGERYGVVWAELRGVVNPNGITEVSRVGVRAYISVGAADEPASDFVIESLAAGRAEDGAPIVSARVRNTGGRALDMTGELRLEEGPGGLTAGPFPAKLGTTLGIGQTAPVLIVMDKRFPAGPWNARLALRSGTTSKEATATITFPDAAGATAPPVEATEVERQKRVLLPIAGALLLLAIAGVVLTALSQRGRRRSASRELDAEPGDQAAVGTSR